MTKSGMTKFERSTEMYNMGSKKRRLNICDSSGVSNSVSEDTTETKWKNWYLQKQHYYACSEYEFFLILKIVINDYKLAKAIHENYYRKLLPRKSRFDFNIPKQIVDCDTVLPFTIKPGHYNSILTLSFEDHNTGSPH